MVYTSIVRRAYPTSTKLNVWAGIFHDKIARPLFLDGNLDGEMYLKLLENNIGPMLSRIFENDHQYSAEQLQLVSTTPNLFVITYIKGFVSNELIYKTQLI